MALTPWDEQTNYRIEESDTPYTVDGYAQGEPKRLICEECGASVTLDADPETPGVDDIPHDATCSQRWARSQWFRTQLD